MNAAHQRRYAPAIPATLAALTVALGACGDDPFAFEWNDEPDTVKIYSLARPELNLPSGFSFYDGLTFPVEQPAASGRWDAALDTQGGSLVLLPPGALGIDGRARIAVFTGISFAQVVEAPSNEDHYVADEPVPVVDGTVYVIRTNLRPGSFGSSCVYYAKMEPLVIDVAGGSLTFQYVTSPICNSRDLTPPD